MRKRKTRSHNKRSETFSFFFHKFSRYREIQSYLRALERHFPNRVKLEKIGCTFEGRDIDMVIIAKDINKKKYAVVIDAGTHAREWLSISSALCIVNHLIRSPILLNFMDFYIIPCLNPDGYEYSHTTCRLWRKNRNTNGTNTSRCFGVDLNRNFPFKFGDLEGSSGIKEAANYHGEHALSELETQALDNVFTSLGATVKLYISLHCYGNLILYPWGYTKAELFDGKDLQECGCACKKAMLQCGIDRDFRVGSVANLMYCTAGCGVDFARGTHGIKFAYSIELQRCGKNGFTPKVSKILEIGSEVICGLGAMVRHVTTYYNIRDCRRPCCRRDHKDHKYPT